MSDLCRFMLIVSLVLASTFVSANLGCDEHTITSENDTLFCYFSSETNTILAPKVLTSNEIDARIVSESKKILKINSKYYIEIKVDLNNSAQGTHNIRLFQGREELTIPVMVDKELGDMNYALEYLEGTINVTLKLPNSLAYNRVATIEIIDLPSGYTTDSTKQTIILKNNDITNIRLNLDYYETNSGNLRILVKTSEGNNYINIPLKKQDMSISSKTTPLFSLVSTKTAIIADVILFALAIVLFTMFIGRLGKKIIKS